MDPLMVVLRAVHVGLGVFWAGGLTFVALFLEPSLRATMPDSAKVQQELMRRRLFDVMPVVAALTLVSGLWMFWRVSGGLDREWLRTGPAHALAFGGLVAIAAFGIGVTVARPAQQKAVALGPRVAQASGAEQDALAAQLQALRRRGTLSLRWTAGLLALATLAMGVARYM